MDLVSQNKENLKVKVTLSISEESRLKAKRMGLNMSSILENALIHGLFSPDSLRFSINAKEKREIPPKTELFSTNKEVLNGIECARFGFNPIETEDEDMVILPISAVEMLINSDFSTITKSKRKLLISHILQQYLYRDDKKHNCTMFNENILRISDISSYMSIGNMPFVPKYEIPIKYLPSNTNCIEKTYYINELFSMYKTEFIEWSKKSIKLESTLNNYVKILEDMKTISRPTDIIHYAERNGGEFTDWKERALTKFFRFLEYNNDNEEEPTINGYSLSMFYKKMEIVRKERKHTQTKNPKQKAISKVIKDAKELTNADIIEELNLLPDGLKNFYKLMVYSGIRASHLYRLLESKNKIIEDKGAFIRVSADNVQLGNKKLFIGMYAPKECMTYIQTFRASAFRTEKNKKYTYENVCARMKNNLSSGKRITSKSLRKFNLNFMRQNGVSAVICDYIQSRCDGSIRMRFYENTNPLADAEYSKIVNLFTELLPF